MFGFKNLWNINCHGVIKTKTWDSTFTVMNCRMLGYLEILGVLCECIMIVPWAKWIT